MIRTALIATVLASSAAFATGERISISAAAAPLKETLCISMNCVNGGARDFVVTGKPVKGGIEITVTSVGGQTRLTHFAALNEWNQISSTDLVHATALVVQSIERGPIAPPAAAKKAVAAAKVKKAKKALQLARR
jgi:hypothetical protein